MSGKRVLVWHRRCILCGRDDFSVPYVEGEDSAPLPEGWTGVEGTLVCERHGS